MAMLLMTLAYDARHQPYRGGLAPAGRSPSIRKDTGRASLTKRAFPELEIGRTGTSIPALLFDMDGDPIDWLVDVLGPDVPRPNWITWRKSNLHAHIAYTLARPVLTGAQARMTPQAWLARIGEYLAAAARTTHGLWPE